MNRIFTDVKAGAAAPFRLLHISDTHLTLCDERDNERKRNLAKARFDYFKNSEQYLNETAAESKREQVPIVHTGDLIDFVSEANLERAKMLSDETDFIFSAGNHEFSLYVGEAIEDEAYRNQSLSHVQESFHDNIRFSSRKINGVNLIMIDDGYYRFDIDQLEALKHEISLGMPIILFMHTPLHEPELYKIMIARTNGSCAYLTSSPDECLNGYDDYRYRQQKPDSVTLETTRLIESCNLVKAIFAGHLHFDYDGIFNCSIPQYVTGIGTERVIMVS